MSRVRHWTFAPGKVCHELEPRDGSVFDLDGRSVAVLVPYVGSRDDLELVIEFSSKGYYDPGVCSGPAENCYPPEGEDERILSEVYLSCAAGKFSLPQAIQEAVFHHYRDEVDAADVDWRDDEGPDPDMLREAREERRQDGGR